MNSPAPSAMGASPLNEEQLTALWLNFVESTNANDFCWNWLAIQCTSMQGVDAGMVLLGTPEKGSYSPAALWPDQGHDLQHLVPIAERALSDRQGVVAAHHGPEGQPPRRYHIAYPVDISGKVYGVVVLEVSDRPAHELQAALRLLHWGSAWLEVIFRREEAEHDKELTQRLATVLELAATVVQPGSYQQVALALVNELATRLHCDRVTLGHRQGNFVHLAAMSHSARFDKKTNLIRAIEAAMDEALDQEETVLSPQPAGSSTANRLHGELTRRFDTVMAGTVPLPGREGLFGAVTLERKSATPFLAAELELVTAVAHLLGPILETHRQNDRWAVARLYDTMGKRVATVLGPRNLAIKLLTGTVTALLLLLCLLPVEYRVSAKTVLEGSVQRVVSAPFDGFLLDAGKRAGDMVAQGETLCRLDDKDLNLEQLKWASEVEQYRRKYQESMANHDRAAARIAEAQINQARAEMALLDEKLSKAKIVAPFAGILVRGDLSQRLGTPVRQGEELFTLVPMEKYRVILQVDEREIVHIKEGSPGLLILSGLTHDKLPFTVKRSTPVTTAEGGRNFFRVEAALSGQADHLRPGMEGIGKIDSGKRSLVWIWTHEITDWFRLWVWSWWL